jgi:hypothetical protein
MTTQIEDITAKGQLVPIVFVQDAVAASQTNVQLTAQDAGVAVDGVSMPFRGAIVGLTWDLTAAGTAGVFTIGATVGGTEDANTTQTVGTAAAGRDTFPRDQVKFVAGDKLGVEITTDGSWDGTTSDLVVVLWVLMQMEGI